MDTLRKTTAAFFAILFIVTAVLALLLFNFDRKAFTAQTYQEAFAREDFYNKLPGMMAKAITTSDSNSGQLPMVMQNMGEAAWEDFLRALLPPEALQAMGDDVLNSSFSYLNMETDSVQVNLTPLKAAMMSDTGTQAVLSLLATQPDCTLVQIAQITMNLLSSGEVAFCNPPADLQPLITPVIAGQMQLAASIIPDQVELAAAPPQNDPRPRLQTIRFMMRLSPILPLFFLLTLTIFAVRSFKDWLNWWGVPFFISGFTVFIMGILGAPVFSAIFQRILVNRLPVYLPSFLLDFTSNLASAMVKALLIPIMWQGALLAVIGVVMAGIGFLIKENKAV